MIVVTRGYGSGASIAFVVTAGYGNYSPVVATTIDVEGTAEINRSVTMRSAINRSVSASAEINRSVSDSADLTGQ